MSLLGSTPPQIRAQLRNQLIAASVPPAIADEAVDLGIHASEAARDALVLCVDRASSLPVQSAAFSIAIGLIQNALSGAVDAMIAHAARQGAKSMVVNAQYGGLGRANTGGPDHG